MSFPRYESYKDSGVEWLGEVPSTWKVEPLKYNTYAKGRIGWQNLRSDEFIEEGPFLVTGMHFSYGGVNWNECYHISEERYGIAPEIQLKIDDVLITKDGSIGKLAYIEYLPGPATLNSHLLVLRPLDNKYIPRFLFYYLSSPEFDAYINLNQTGTTFFGITQERIVNLPLALPSIREQSSIASFLDRETAKINSLIAEQEKLISLLAEKRQAVISHAVTKGLNPDAPTKDSGIEWLGEVPAEWKLLPLKRDLAFLTSGSRGWAEHYAEEGALFIRIANLTRDGINLNLSDIQRVVVSEGTEVERTKVQTDDVLFSITAYLGSVAVVSDGLETAYVSQHVALTRLKKKYLIPEWVAYVTLSSIGKTYLAIQGYGGTKIQLSLYDVANIIMTVPSIQEQITIVNFINRELVKVDALVSEAKQAITLLKERRSALISAAVTGKIDVRNA